MGLSLTSRKTHLSSEPLFVPLPLTLSPSHSFTLTLQEPVAIQSPPLFFSSHPITTPLLKPTSTTSTNHCSYVTYPHFIPPHNPSIKVHHLTKMHRIKQITVDPTEEEYYDEDEYYDDEEPEQGEQFTRLSPFPST